VLKTQICVTRPQCVKELNKDRLKLDIDIRVKIIVLFCPRTKETNTADYMIFVYLCN